MTKDSITYNKAIRAIASEITSEGGRILVTGSTGLIGSCIIDVLLAANFVFEKNFEIFALGRSEEKLRNRFGTQKGLHFVIQDVIEPINTEGLDYIIHAASNADPKTYALYPAETIITNIQGAKNILDYCKQKSARVLFTSTFEVYGKLEKNEYDEEQYGIIDLNLLRSCYPESKRTAEMLFKAYADEYGVDCVIARLASIYGPTMKQDDSKAHAQFIRNALAGEDIVLKSKGEQIRTYCYVMDAVSGLLAVLFRGKTGEAYNVANEASIASIAELAQIVADYTGTKVVFDLPDEIERKGFSKPQNCILKTDKIKALGWNGKYDLKTGINETMTILKEIAE
jgi:nucleoside-diphosphate-sugar epimerase